MMARCAPFMGRGRACCIAAAMAATAAMFSGCAALRAVGPIDLPEGLYTSAQHNDFGVVYESQGDLKRARRQYERAVRRDPANAIAWTNLGNVLDQVDRSDMAQDAYRRALAVSPGYAPAANNLALTYLDSPNPNPTLATKIIQAHIHLAAPEFLEALHETLLRARDAGGEEGGETGGEERGEAGGEEEKENGEAVRGEAGGEAIAN